MNTTALVPEGQQTLTYWPALPPDEQAFVAAYVENSYSLPLACGALGKNKMEGERLLKKVGIRRAVAEIQHELDGIDFLNEKWVKAQLLRLFPMVMGDESVPMVTATGEETNVRKFSPDIAMRIIEYVAPKAHKPSVSISINNINKLSDEQLAEIAMKGMRIINE